MATIIFKSETNAKIYSIQAKKTEGIYNAGEEILKVKTDNIEFYMKDYEDYISVEVTKEVKASFSVSLKNPKKLTNNKGFKKVSFFFSCWKNSLETNQEFRIRCLATKGININDCNYTDVSIN